LVVPFADRSASELIAIDFGYPWQRRTLHVSKNKEEPTMSVVINTNSAATIASNNLSASNAMLQRSLNRLSSGSKIVNASDDAGGVAVASRLSAAAKRSGVVAGNISNAVSYLQHQDSVLKTVEKMVTRQSELAALYDDTTKSSADLALYETEFQALGTQIAAISALKWNDDVDLLGDAKSVTVSENGDDVYSIGNASATGYAGGAIATGVEAELTAIASARATNGAEQSTLGFYAELNSASKANFESAASVILDVDVAQESTQLARWNTLVQAGTSMLAQANSTTQTVLSLLR
jgi:flagellin